MQDLANAFLRFLESYQSTLNRTWPIFEDQHSGRFEKNIFVEVDIVQIIALYLELTYRRE